MSAIAMHPTASVPEVLPLTRETLEQLTGERAPAPTFLSAYVRLGVEDRVRGRYRTAVRDAARRVEQLVEETSIGHTRREQVRSDLDRIRIWLDDSRALPHAPGMAVFACTALERFAVLPLPRVRVTRLHLDYGPRLAEAMAGLVEFGRMVAVLLDRNHARFFECSADGARELPGLVSESVPGGRFHADRRNAPGWGERDYHHRLREIHHRRAADVTAGLARLVAEAPCQGVVIAGPARTTAEQLRFLPRSLRRLVVGTPRLNPTTATVAEVSDTVQALRAAAERAEERSLVEELEDAVGRGWAVTGARATLRALGRGQLRLLLVRAGQTGWGFRCGESHRLVLSRADCRGEGEALAVADLVNEAVEEALTQGVDVVVVDDREAGSALDGLAGMLRFR